MPLLRGCGVALGLACDDISALGQTGNCQVTYRNLSFSTVSNKDVVDQLLNKHGFLSEQAYYQISTDSVRFLTQIDDLSYKEVGFDLVATYNGKTSEVLTKTTQTAYRSILAEGESVSAEDGQYWVCVTVTGIPDDSEVTITVRPFVVTSGGEKLYGYCGTAVLNQVSK
jgi:hypothetical protein